MTETTATVTQIAMLTMDLQPAALASLEDAALVIGTAVRAVDIARRAGAHVGSVHMAFTEEELRAVPGTSCLARSVAAAGPALLVGSTATAVQPEVAPLPGDIVVRKTRVGAFHGSDLDDRLRERGADTVVLAGVQTSGVVLTAVREAADRDYRILVVADACADPHRDLHDLLLRRVFPRQAEVVPTSALATTLDRMAADPPDRMGAQPT